jgi:hypothetical protein
LTVWNKTCEFLESKDGEIRHKSEANGKVQLGRSRPVIGFRTNDDDDDEGMDICLVVYMLYCPV